MVTDHDGSVLAGLRVRLSGSWRQRQRSPWFLVTSTALVSGSEGAWRWTSVRWRAALVERLHERYGERGPLVSALILARKEGLDSDLREAFARTRIAHLLAISGFHVGVVSGLILAVVQSFRVPRRRAAVVAAVTTWLYVALIGFPDAACRAALIIALLSLSRCPGLALVPPHAGGRSGPRCSFCWSSTRGASGVRASSFRSRGRLAWWLGATR